MSKLMGTLEVLVCKESIGWSKKLNSSKSFIEMCKNFPRVYVGTEVEVKNKMNEKEVYYFSTKWDGTCKAELPAGNYLVTVKQGDQPSRNISVLPGKRSEVYFSVKDVEQIEKNYK